MKEITLTRGYVALVDDEDYERVAAHKWQAQVVPGVYSTRVYAQRAFYAPKRESVRLHQFILGVRLVRVDHRDGNGLNNQRYNLRIATDRQNSANRKKDPRSSSRWNGVYWAKPNHRWSVGRWRACISLPGSKKLDLGYFKDECDAATAYNFAAEEVHGEFAVFNRPLAELGEGPREGSK